MPVQDDTTISGDVALLRGLIERWVKEDQGRIRPTSDAFTDSNGENSCFIDRGCTPEQARLLIPEARTFARFPVRILRENGFGVERRPDECPASYPGDRSDHVVVGPTNTISRKEYERSARRIVKHPDMRVDP